MEGVPLATELRDFALLGTEAVSKPTQVDPVVDGSQRLTWGGWGPGPPLPELGRPIRLVVDVLGAKGVPRILRLLVVRSPTLESLVPSGIWSVRRRTGICQSVIRFVSCGAKS